MDSNDNHVSEMTQAAAKIAAMLAAGTTGEAGMTPGDASAALAAISASISALARRHTAAQPACIGDDIEAGAPSGDDDGGDDDDTFAFRKGSPEWAAMIERERRGAEIAAMPREQQEIAIWEDGQRKKRAQLKRLGVKVIPTAVAQGLWEMGLMAMNWRAHDIGAVCSLEGLTIFASDHGRNGIRLTAESLGRPFPELGYTMTGAGLLALLDSRKRHASEAVAIREALAGPLGRGQMPMPMERPAWATLDSEAG